MVRACIGPDLPDDSKKLMDTPPSFPELWVGRCSLVVAERLPQSWQRTALEATSDTGVSLIQMGIAANVSRNNDAVLRTIQRAPKATPKRLIPRGRRRESGPVSKTVERPRLEP